jgi:hypothetical protein
MPLTKPNQDLRRELKGVAFNLEQSCIDLGRLAQRIDGADGMALMELVGKIYEDADRLVALADQVKAGQIMRAKPE